VVVKNCVGAYFGTNGAQVLLKVWASFFTDEDNDSDFEGF